MASFIAEQVNEIVLNLDYDASVRAVKKLRSTHSYETNDQLVDKIIQRKCMHAGAVGAVTSGSALIPTVGTVAAMTFGVAVDMKMTFKIQCELVLEIAAAYDRAIEQEEFKNIILAVTGVSAGTQLAVDRVGRHVATEVTTKFAEKSLTKAIPFIGVAATGGSNIVTTYIIGRRAQAYFKLGPAEMVNWQDAVRAITGVNEKEIVEWLRQTTEASFNLVNEGSKSTKNAIAVASQKTRTAIIVYSDRASEAIQNTGKKITSRVTNFDQIVSEETEEKPGIVGRFISMFQRNKENNNEELQPVTEEEIEKIASSLNDAEIENEVIVGVIGADDKIEDESSGKDWNLKNVLDMFTWDIQFWNTSNGRQANVEEVKDLYHSESEPEVVIVGDDEGFFANIGKVFNRNNELTPNDTTKNHRIRSCTAGVPILLISQTIPRGLIRYMVRHFQSYL